jgi:hypothetical protein
MFGAIAVMRGENPDPTTINILFLIHMLFYFPSLALTNRSRCRSISRKAVSLGPSFRDVRMDPGRTAISQLNGTPRSTCFIWPPGPPRSRGSTLHSHTPPLGRGGNRHWDKSLDWTPGPPQTPLVPDIHRQFVPHLHTARLLFGLEGRATINLVTRPGLR